MNTLRRRAPIRDLPVVGGFQQYARFERVSAEDNCQRFYALSWQPLLWGGRALVRTWGRIGTQGQQRLEGDYVDRQAAQPLVEHLVRRRLPVAINSSTGPESDAQTRSTALQA
jgi:predicted DNA-binding WGR domain protein